MELINNLDSIAGLATTAIALFFWFKNNPLDRQHIQRFENWMTSPLKVVEVEGVVHFSVSPKGIAFGFIEACRAAAIIVFLMLASLSFFQHYILDQMQLKGILAFICYAALGFSTSANFAFMRDQHRSKLLIVILSLLVALASAGLLKLGC